MNDAPHAFTAARAGSKDDPSDVSTGMARIEAALIAYAEAYEAGPIPILTLAERRQQALAGLEHVAALDPERGACFISIHHKTWSDKENDCIFPGSAHENFDTALRDAFYWANKKADGRDVYWAMGGQKEPGEHYNGREHPSARRWRNNTAACRCLYMDIDVKPDEPKKAYPTTRAAAEALIGFIGATGLQPTMVIGSGTGGFHVYWRLGRTVTPTEFKSMAETLVKTAQSHGLKFDAQCTNDVCRLLRVPGTWNFKHGGGTDARPVTIVYEGDSNA
jgi:hypothetical protein